VVVLTESRKFSLALLVALSCLHLSAWASDEEAEEKAFMKKSQTSTPAQLMKLINSGWGSMYSQARKDLNPKKSYVLLHAWDPGTVMDLRTADGFRATLHSLGIINMGDIKIGHTWIGWRCQTSSGVLEGAAGQTGENEKQTAAMLKSGWGLSAFKSSFSDGFLQWPEYLEWLVDEEPGTLHGLFIEVDTAVCMKTANFVKDYVSHPKQPRKIFGLEPNPAKFEGGGCGSFGITAAQVGGVFGARDLATKFWRTLSARSEIFGRGSELPPYTIPFYSRGVTQNRPVSLLNPLPFSKDVLFSNWNGIRPSDPSLKVLDPELLILSIRQIYRSKFGELSASNRTIANEFLTSKNPGYAYRIFPTGEISETETLRNYRVSRGASPNVLRFDQSFDPRAQQTINLTKQWLSEANFKAKFTKVDRHPSIILERK